MRGWADIRGALALATATIWIASPGLADSRLSCQQIFDASYRNRVESPPRLAVTPVSARELTGGASDVGRALPGSLDDLTDNFLSQRITRTIIDLWRRRIPANIHPGELRVKYRLLNGNANTGQLRHRQHQGRALPIALKPIPPTILCERGGYRIVQGGVVLEVDPSELQSAGRYHVQIETTVELP